MKNLAAFIFARGGSKGVKNKNIRMVAGKPLIAHSIENALKSKSVTRVIVSTDSPDIAKAAKDAGAEALMRPAELAADDTPEILAWRHAIENSSIFPAQDVFISLPATSPLRAPEDIDAGVGRFARGDCDIVFSITKSGSSPYLSMVTINKDDLLQICIPGSAAVRRQDVPDVYDIAGSVYVTRPDYVMSTKKLIDGRIGYVEVPREHVQDIDTEFDLHVAELLLKFPFKKA